MTTGTPQQIQALHGQGLSGVEIAGQLGIKPGTVYYWLGKMGLKPTGAVKPKVCYVIYDQHDNVRATGSARECAEALGVRVSTVYSTASRARKNGTGRVVTV